MTEYAEYQAAVLLGTLLVVSLYFNLVQLCSIRRKVQLLKDASRHMRKGEELIEEMLCKMTDKIFLLAASKDITTMFHFEFPDGVEMSDKKVKSVLVGAPVHRGTKNFEVMEQVSTVRDAWVCKKGGYEVSIHGQHPPIIYVIIKNESVRLIEAPYGVETERKCEPR